MRYVAGIILGGLSGVLIYFLAAMFFVSDPAEIGSAFVFVTLVGGWVASSWVMIRETRTAWRVVTRGSLIGAAEWLLMIPAGMVFSAQSASQVETTTEAAAAGAALGAGFTSVVTGGIALAMTVVCLLVFVVAYFLRKEMAPED